MLTKLGGFRFDRWKFRNLVALRELIGNLWQRPPAVLALRGKQIRDVIDLLGR